MKPFILVNKVSSVGKKNVDVSTGLKFSESVFLLNIFLADVKEPVYTRPFQ